MGIATAPWRAGAHMPPTPKWHNGKPMPKAPTPKGAPANSGTNDTEPGNAAVPPPKTPPAQPWSHISHALKIIKQLGNALI